MIIKNKTKIKRFENIVAKCVFVPFLIVLNIRKFTQLKLKILVVFAKERMETKLNNKKRNLILCEIVIIIL